MIRPEVSRKLIAHLKGDAPVDCWLQTWLVFIPHSLLSISCVSTYSLRFSINFPVVMFCSRILVYKAVSSGDISIAKWLLISCETCMGQLTRYVFFLQMASSPVRRQPITWTNADLTSENKIQLNLYQNELAFDRVKCFSGYHIQNVLRIPKLSVCGNYSSAFRQYDPIASAIFETWPRKVHIYYIGGYKQNH